MSTPATVTLDIVYPGSGAGATYYVIDGGERQTYVDPIIISRDGVTSLLYWSESSVEGGEAEQAKQIKVRVDASEPTVDVVVVANSSGRARVKLTARDVTSGLLYIETSVDGAAFKRIDGLDAARERAVELDIVGRGGHDVSYRVVDRAINRTGGSRGLSVKGSQRVRFTGTKRAVTIKRTRGSAYFTARVLCVDETGMPLAGRRLILQRSTNGKDFKSYATATSADSGAASHRFRERKVGTTYWRWYAPGDAQFAKGYSSTITVKTR